MHLLRKGLETALQPYTGLGETCRAVEACTLPYKKRKLRWKQT